MKYTIYLIILTTIQYNCISNNTNSGLKGAKLNIDSLYYNFLSDTGNKQKLKYCDSILFSSFQGDSLNISILKKLKVTQLYLGQFDFVLKRIYPKLHTDEKLKDYELFRLYELKRDSIQYCFYLNKAQEKLKYIDFNNTSNIEYIIAYLDLLFVQKGEDFTQSFITNNINNDSILNYPYYIKNFNSGAKKWHKFVYLCR